MTRLQRFLIGLLLVATVTSLSEVITGYFLTYRMFTHRPALETLFDYVKSGTLKTVKPELAAIPSERLSTKTENPFISHYGFGQANFNYKIHPFFDYSGVHIKEPQYNKLDYFGFRNDTDLYFKRGSELLIVIGGGSEAGGFGHQVTIARNLEKYLIDKLGRPVKVLNLGMNSYTVANEINAYIQLAYDLKLDFVISHSGYNDAYYGIAAPPRFKQLGFHYFTFMKKWWLPRLYLLSASQEDPHEINSLNLEDVRKGYFKGLEKYKAIVENHGGKFIAGLQPFREKPVSCPSTPTWYQQQVSKQLDLFQKDAEGRSFLVFNHRGNFTFLDGDNVHTNEGGSLKSAQIYGDEVVKQLRAR